LASLRAITPENEFIIRINGSREISRIVEIEFNSNERIVGVEVTSDNDLHPCSFQFLVLDKYLLSALGGQRGDKQHKKKLEYI
jgi:hypothetical protein